MDVDDDLGSEGGHCVFLLGLIAGGAVEVLLCVCSGGDFAFRASMMGSNGMIYERW